MTWRYNIKDILQHKRSNLDHIYQFGIYLGESLIELKDIYNTSINDAQKFWGFDSFCGTPNTEREGQWEPHSFSAQRDTNSTNIMEATSKIVSKLRPYFNGIATYYNSDYVSRQDQELVIFSGFYSDSLKDNIAKYMKPAFYVDIDCDLYSSTVEALDFMFRNKLIVSGTILGFDDWGGTEGWQTASDGESKAFVEMLRKYNMEAHCIRQLGDAYPHVVRVYEIL